MCSVLLHLLFLFFLSSFSSDLLKLGMLIYSLRMGCLEVVILNACMM